MLKVVCHPIATYMKRIGWIVDEMYVAWKIMDMDGAEPLNRQRIHRAIGSRESISPDKVE